MNTRQEFIKIYRPDGSWTLELDRELDYDDSERVALRKLIRRMYFDERKTMKAIREELDVGPYIVRTSIRQDVFNLKTHKAKLKEESFQRKKLRLLAKRQIQVNQCKFCKTNVPSTRKYCSQWCEDQYIAMRVAILSCKKTPDMYTMRTVNS